MTTKEILAENYEQIEGICRRLPAHHALIWASGHDMYANEGSIQQQAYESGLAQQFNEALSKKLRGQRLVVIVTASETLYQFV